MPVTIKDIARLTGTSPSAVSLVMNNRDAKRVAPERRRAILAAAQKHGYHRNLTAAGLVLRRSFRVALCIRGLFHQYPILGNFSLYETISLLSEKLHGRGYGIDLVQVDRTMPPRAVAMKLAQENVDGTLFLNWDSAPLRRVLPALRRRGMAVVALGSRVGNLCDWAEVDRAAAFDTAATALLDAGLRRIVVLDPEMGAHQAEQRAGYVRAMRRRGLRPRPFIPAAPTVGAVTQAVGRLLDDAPDVEGLLLTDNFFAPTILHALGNRRLRILGFGDRCFADVCLPRLSYMKLPTEALAEFGVQAILRRMESPAKLTPAHRMIPCDLVMQET